MRFQSNIIDRVPEKLTRMLKPFNIVIMGQSPFSQLEHTLSGAGYQ